MSLNKMFLSRFYPSRCALDMGIFGCEDQLLLLANLRYRLQR